jgi:hypothetical protein
MKQKLFSAPVMVLAVVALALGSVGVATGAPGSAAKITKGKVKKIATQVVQAQAPNLSVASAGNATTLDGKPASSYLNRAYTYAFPDSAPTTDFKTFYFDGVPPGTYLVTYSLFVDSAGEIIECSLGEQPPTASSRSEGFARGVPLGGSGHAVNASGVQKVTGVPYLFCGSGGPAWSIDGAYLSTQSRITYTRLDEVTAIAPSPPPS